MPKCFENTVIDVFIIKTKTSSSFCFSL